jgi:hypothetical protein
LLLSDNKEGEIAWKGAKNQLLVNNYRELSLQYLCSLALKSHSPHPQLVFHAVSFGICSVSIEYFVMVSVLTIHFKSVALTTHFPYSAEVKKMNKSYFSISALGLRGLLYGELYLFLYPTFFVDTT